ncbi:phosphoenolpyruvate hydrolase family protein [Gorillibacterium sp. sgz500922]|uniref:phosphoenolpyruvate hydrolase family protein n=1 Tax=Gorillibacterium sp. sgz500922 TaxID=3446694 RepID=UPI003F680104
MQTRRTAILEALSIQTRMKRRIIGVSCGSGLAAKQAERGGADLLLALNSGRFRMMGQGSLAGFLPFTNSNQLVMEFGARELVPAVEIPVVFGLNATDPTIQLDRFIYQIKASGFAGINNYPTLGLIDGQYREGLEEQGLTYDREVEAIRLAHEMGLFTIAFVFEESQAESMLQAGADVLCVHLGLTKGGALGAKKVLTLEAGTELAQRVFSVGDRLRPEVFKMVYGGPVHTPMDLEYISNNTSAQGYIGGSTFDRTPSERAIEERVRQFKTAGQYENDELLQKMLFGIDQRDYVGFVKEYIAQNYMNEIAFTDLAAVAKLSRSHLSTLFRKETGLTFPAFLTNFRIHKACSILEQENLPLTQVAELVGYRDYAHFSKTFKKVIGLTPSEYAQASERKIDKA